MTLHQDLIEAAQASAGKRPCGLCEYIASIDDIHTFDALRDAAAGTIGIRKLEFILRKHDARDNNDKPVGRRTILRHRQEEHTP